MLKIVWEMGNGEAKEPIYMTHGHELRGGVVGVKGRLPDREGQRGKNLDKYNSIINKIYLKNKIQNFLCKYE